MSRGPRVPHPWVGELLDRWFVERGGPPKRGLDRVLARYVRSLSLHRRRAFHREPRAAGPLRIALLTRWPFPHRGGLSTYLENLSAALRRRGHSVEVLSERSFGDAWQQVKRKVRFQVRQAYARYGKGAGPLERSEYGLVTYERLLDREERLAPGGVPAFDVVHAHDLYTANILLRRRRVHRAPVVYTPHGLLSQRKLELEGVDPRSVAGVYFRLLEQLAAAGADRVVPLYQEFARRLAPYGAGKGRTRVVYTGIPDTEHLPAVHREGARVLVAYVGRLTETKGPQHLLQAWYRLGVRPREARLVIAGSGGLEQALRRRIRGWRLDGVHLLGYRSDVLRLLAGCHVLVVPGTNESFPLAMLEGMMAGLAVVASACGGIPEAVRHEETGLLFPPGEPEALAACLGRLLTDPGLRRRLGREARTYARAHFSVDRMAAELEEVYREALSTGGGEGP